MSSVTMASAVIGRAGREGANEPFSTIISSNGNVNAANLNTVLLQSAVGSPLWQGNRRGFMVFNPLTYPLPAGYIISAAAFKLTTGTPLTNLFAQSLCLTSAVMASPLTSVAAADYQGTASSRTEYAARVTLASLTINTVTTWTVNATGLAYVIAQYLAGNPIVMGMRWSSDVDQTSPTWVSATAESIPFSTAQLVLTYRVGPGHAVLDLTGTLTNSADTVNASMFVVELFS